MNHYLGKSLCTEIKVLVQKDGLGHLHGQLQSRGCNEVREYLLDYQIRIWQLRVRIQDYLYAELSE